MKILIFIIALLAFGCSNLKTENVPIYVEKDGKIYIDTIVKVKVIKMARQERLALKDSMKHIEKLMKIENDRLKDSLNYMKRFIKNERKASRDSFNFQIKHYKILVKELKAELKSKGVTEENELKKMKQENKRLKIENKAIKDKDRNNRKGQTWYLWLIIALLVISLLLNVFLLLIKR